MDKILLCSSDIEDLLRWRDKHKELMGRDNRPMRAVEIVITDNGYRIKAIRDGASLKLHLNIGGRSVGRAYFARRLDGMFVAEAGDIRLDKKAIGDNDAKEVARSMLTVYCSLMTLMVYGKDGVEQNEPKKQTTAHKRSNKAHKKPKKWITYILHRKAGGVSGGSQRLPRKSKRNILCARSFPALQKRKSSLDCRVQQRDREEKVQDLQAGRRDK